MKKRRRPYSSPLRAAQVQETREAILRSVAVWMQKRPHDELTLNGVARHAGIERRTVHRHFQTKEALLAAFWTWISERLSPRTWPRTCEELVAGPRQVFAAFDGEEGLVRASLHSAAGRDMRLAEVAERRAAFREALREAVSGASPGERRNLECIAHVLHSAAAWEAMRDYAGASGQEAGGAASWALGILTNAVRRGIASELGAGAVPRRPTRGTEAS